MRTPLHAIALSLLLAACASEAAPPAGTRTPANEMANPLAGAWELIRGEYTSPAGATSVEEHGRPFQLKLFTPTHFAFLMRNVDGTFREAGAGRYTVAGDTYRETHTYQSYGGYIDFTATWRYRVSGDTLYMEGPTQVLDAAGHDVTQQIGRMKEVRIRAN